MLRLNALNPLNNLAAMRLLGAFPPSCSRERPVALNYTFLGLLLTYTVTQLLKVQLVAGFLQLPTYN